MSQSDLPIRTILDLSTAHLREETCDRLGSYEGVLAYRTKYGRLMYAPDSCDRLADQGDWPEELLPIVKLARDNDCGYVLFDADAPEVDRLPTFDR